MQGDENLSRAGDDCALGDGGLRSFVLIHQHAERAHRDETEHGGLDHDEDGEVLLLHTAPILTQGARRVNLSYATTQRAGAQ